MCKKKKKIPKVFLTYLKIKNKQIFSVHFLVQNPPYNSNSLIPNEHVL